MPESAYSGTKMQSRSNGKKRIFPIFYKVEPGHVKHRTPRPKNLSSEVELRAFKGALAKVGQIKGWKVEEGQSQAKIVDLVVRKVLEELGRKDESQTEHPIELDDLTESLEDSYNRAVMRYAGRESLSRGSIGRGTSLSSTSTERRWSNLSVNRMEGMDMEEASVSTGRSGIKGSLSINRMEDMYTEEGSGSTGRRGRSGSSRSRGSSGSSRRTSSSRRGRSRSSGSSRNSSREEEAGEAVGGSFQDICLGAFSHGMVNGAVQACKESFHRFDKYLKFCNSITSEISDPSACGRAYGMKIFDLKEWKKRNIMGIYH
ncbi:uncharacterized protein LOC120292680 [Eucalyptus grandis]|uniref:uncharacterized protein LOC120292680 n=1 Tax=Eucalyptus grandis TaxID=71139 RepID=UPI00192ED613|nr:uncharacterized protein LOC120292680 [Eucalyptus grandis]